MIYPKSNEHYIMSEQHKINMPPDPDWMLKENESLYQSIYQHSPLCIAFSDMEGKIIQINQKFCTLVGYSKQELIGRFYAELTPSDQIQKELHEIKGILQQKGKNCRYEKCFYHKKGHLIWTDISMSFVYDPITNEPQYTIAMISDISEKIQMAKALEKSQEALKKQNADLEIIVNRRTKELKSFNEQLQQSNHDLKQFAFIASHDLKEPLRTIGSFASLVEKRYATLLGEEGKEYIGFITNGVDRMSKLIRSLLTYSQTSNTDLNFSNINVNTLVSSILKDLSLVIQEKKVQINIGKLPSNLIGIESKVNMLFANLITNAIKFNDSDSPTIDIDCVEVNDFYTFSIKDNGIGIAKEYQEKIFILFNRLHNKSKYEGTGIGLSLCKKIVSQHGGDIHLESAEGEGACFFFSFAKNIEEQYSSNKLTA